MKIINLKIRINEERRKETLRSTMPQKKIRKLIVAKQTRVFTNNQKEPKRMESIIEENKNKKKEKKNRFKESLKQDDMEQLELEKREKELKMR